MKKDTLFNNLEADVKKLQKDELLKLKKFTDGLEMVSKFLVRNLDEKRISDSAYIGSIILFVLLKLQDENVIKINEK